MPRFDVKVDDGSGRLVPFQLAMDDKGQPLYTQHLLEPVHISIYSQSEEARYANLLPNVGSIYAQDDLSGGLGKKTQVRHGEPGFDRYYWADWWDNSVRGQEQKGPQVVTMTAPANSGPLSGFFTLSGVPYLVLGRRIASWSSGSPNVLTAVKDFGGGVTGNGGETFLKLAAEASVATSTGTGGSAAASGADVLLAQSIRIQTSGVFFLSRVDVQMTKNGTPLGDVRLQVQTDLNGRPSGVTIGTARQLAANVTVGAVVISFRFDDNEIIPVFYNEPFWLVLDVAAATAGGNYLNWTLSTTDTYAAGTGAVSTDGGNSWTNNASSTDFYFVLYAKAPAATAFVGLVEDSNPFVTSTDGSTYTGDTYRFSTLFRRVGDLLVRNVRVGGGGLATGSIQTSTDGLNWSEALVIGSSSTDITNLLTLGDVLIVCKTDGVYAVDTSASPVDVQELYGNNTATSNGLGSTVWRDAAYIPFNGRLLAVQGDFTNGFTVHESVGIESLPEWDWPWGQGRHVACVGTRFHLYSAVSATGTYKLLKCANPLKKTAEGLPDPDWHGSLASVGDGTQSVTMMAYYDPGSSGSPELFLTTTNNDVARIQMPRSFNPASDPNYVYDIVTPGDVYFPYASGNYPVHPKSWLVETTTFHRRTASDYTEMLYDDFNGESWRRLPRGRQYDTGALPYPRNLASTLLARRLRVTTTAQTTCPLLSAHSVSMAVRHIKGAAMREISFTVVAEDGLSAADLGEMLGWGGSSAMGVLDDAAGGGGGTRRMEDPWGRVYERVQFLDVTRVLQQTGRDGPGRTLLQVSAVAVT